MEDVTASERIKLLVQDWLLAQVAQLLDGNGNMIVLLKIILGSELLSSYCVALQLFFEIYNLFEILIQRLRQSSFDIFNLFVVWQQRKQVFNRNLLQIKDLQRFFGGICFLLLPSSRRMLEQLFRAHKPSVVAATTRVSLVHLEQVFGDFPPQLPSFLLIIWLIGLFFRQIHVSNSKGKQNCFFILT